MARKAKKIRYWFEWAVLASMFRLVPLWPRFALRALARILGAIAFYVDGRGRRTLYANLKAAFPGRWTDEEIEAVGMECYRSFAQTFLDQFWTRRIHAGNFFDYTAYEFEDPEDFRKILETGSIGMLPHYSNFEWGSANIAFHGLTAMAIAQDFKNPRLTELFKRNREHHGHQMVSQRRAMLKFLRHLKKGGHVAFLPDVTTRPGKSATIIEMFGMKASVTLLGPILAKRTGLPVLMGYALPLPDGTYYAKVFSSITFPDDATEQEIAQACWDKVEPVIRKHPAYWMWMYKHWRYVPPGETGRYPAYAKNSGRFNRLEERMRAERESTKANP